MKKRSIVLAVAVFALVFLVTGCGGKKDFNLYSNY